MKKLIFLLLFISFISSQTPDPKQIRSVLSYFDNGKEAVLLEAALTTKVENMEPVDKITMLNEGQTLWVWLKFAIPRNTIDSSFYVKITKGEKVIKNKKFTLEAKIYPNHGYRTWTAKKLYSAGVYKIEIFHNEKMLQSFQLQVNK
jgi:hypothetical protein